MKNLVEYNKEQLKNIASQLMVPAVETAQANKGTIIRKIEAKAEELQMAIPEPESNVEVKTANPIKDGPKRIQDYPRRTVVVESRDSQWKQKVFGLNTYQALIVFGKPVSLPLPVIDYIKTLRDTVHETDLDGVTKRRFQPRFFITEPSKEELAELE